MPKSPKLPNIAEIEIRLAANCAKKRESEINFTLIRVPSR